MKKLKLLAVLIAIIMTTNVHAALQSRPSTEAKKTASYYEFFKLIRDMEAEGGSLGLNAIFVENSNNKTYEETSESNNIDTHMCKNTEWGTVAMLSASDYGAGNGNVKSDYNRTTKTHGVMSSTTGNMTGVFGMAGGESNGEAVAAGIINDSSSSFDKWIINSASRYIDIYADSSDKNDLSRYIPGDATYETMTFTNIASTFAYSTYPKLFRNNNSVFVTSAHQSGWVITSRLVVWVGEGL